MDEQISWYAAQFGALIDGVGAVIRGKDEQVRLALTCLVSGGHLLIEDVPGTGKTALARTMAALVDGTWNRIQFTPDLLPADVTGVTVYNQRSLTFEFHQGPVFANIVVADEVNRAGPKTQAALLEVMEERQVTVDANSYQVPRPFTVVATQNPIEFDGTYPLPEAQLDRFLMRIGLGYPSLEEEARVVESGGANVTIPQLTAVSSTSIIQTLQTIADRVELVPEVLRYLLDIARATRETPELRLGVSTRGVIAMATASRTFAASHGRGYVTPDDIKTLVTPVWAHRCMLTPDAQFNRRTAATVLDDIVEGRSVRLHAAR